MIIPVFSWLSNAKDASSIVLKDVTGVYNAGTNPGGYGAPNSPTPAIVGLSARYWPDILPYGNFITNNAGTIAALLSNNGYQLTQANLGITASEFNSGVYHFKYYPMETMNTIVTLTQNSKLVTVTAGTAPDTWNAVYKGLLFFTGITLGNKVYLIDKTQPITSTSFYITEAWSNPSVTGYSLYIATEGDLKVLVKEPADNCVVNRIGKLAESCGCNKGEIDTLMRFTMWLTSAQINFDNMDFMGAHNKVAGVSIECDSCQNSCGCN